MIVRLWYLCYSGVIVGQYLHSVTKRLAIGTELLYQYGPNVPGYQIAVHTLAGRYAGTSKAFRQWLPTFRHYLLVSCSDEVRDMCK